MSLTSLVDRTSARIIAAPTGPEVEEAIDKSTHSNLPATQPSAKGDQTSKAKGKSSQKKHGRAQPEGQPNVRAL